MNEKVAEIFKTAVSVFDIVKKLGLPQNGTSCRLVNKAIDELHLDKTILAANRHKEIYDIRTCPVCGKTFEVRKNCKKESLKITCSYSCSNKYFKRGTTAIIERTNLKIVNKKKKIGQQAVRRIAFTHHKKECCICGEFRIVEVHHYDKDRTHNTPDNLVPLCPTHHAYVHSRYHTLLDDKISKYVNDFKAGVAKRSTAMDL